MPVSLSDSIVLGVSSSALFDTRAEHQIYMDRGKAEYVQYQIKNEENPFLKGPAFPLVESMLRLNNEELPKRVEVVAMSQNQPTAGLRVMNSIEHYSLGITRSCFTGGAPVSKYLGAYNVSLFLSRDKEDVKNALSAGYAAGLLYDYPLEQTEDERQLRLAFDGDAVIFSGESEKIYKEKGLKAFHRNEKKLSKKPMAKGPFAKFLSLISDIQNAELSSTTPSIRTALITARDRPADKRVIGTLREYGVEVDEMFFMGGLSKKEVLKVFQPHIFFDDQDVHVDPASSVVPSALVPSGESGASSSLSTPATEDSKSGITQEFFTNRAREILLQYLPLDSNRLTSEMSTFVVRNKIRSSSERSKIISELEKYDLSKLEMSKLTLNREGVVSIEKTLRQVEENALG